MVSFPNIVLTVAFAAVITLAVISLCSKQLVAEVQPSPVLPSYRCQVTIFFHNRRTECPGRPTTNYRTPRNEGFFECVSAYDKWMTAFALTVMGCIFTFFAGLLSIAASFVPPTTTTVRARSFIIAGLASASFLFFVIAWPLARANVKEEQCGRPLRGFVMSTHTTVISASLAYGHGCLVAAWAVSTVAMFMAIAIAVTTKNPVPAAKDAEEGKNAPDSDSDELTRVAAPSAAPAPGPVVYDAPATATAALAV